MSVSLLDLTFCVDWISTASWWWHCGQSTSERCSVGSLATADSTWSKFTLHISL